MKEMPQLKDIATLKIKNPKNLGTIIYLAAKELEEKYEAQIAKVLIEKDLKNDSTT